MLDSFRKNQGNFVFSLLILGVVAVMAFYGVDQFTRDQGGAGGVAAWVNGEAITNRDFQIALEDRIEDFRAKIGDQLDEKFIAQFQIPQHTLDEMVQYKLVGQQAYRLGFRVPDEELASAIRKAPAFQKDGRFDPELYHKYPNRGLEERRVREGMLIRRLQSYLARRIVVPPDMLDREYQLKETKVNLGYARIDFKALAGKPNPTNADIEAFLKATPAEAIKAYYDSHQRDFTQPAAVNLRQIRVGIPFQASAEKKAEAKKKIEDIAKQVTADNFEASARKFSDDEHAKKGGVVGWVNRGTLEAAMEDAINKLQPGEVSPPVQTSFGYYLLQVKDLRPESMKPLDSVKTDIAKEMWREKQISSFVEKKKQEWNKKLAEGKGIEAELKAAHIDIKKTGPFSLGQGHIPQIGQADEILDAVFDLSKAKPVAPKLYANGNDFYYVKLESVEGPKASEADANRRSVATNQETTLQTTFLTEWIEKLKEGSAIRIEAKFETAAPNPFSLQ